MLLLLHCNVQTDSLDLLQRSYPESYNPSVVRYNRWIITNVEGKCRSDNHWTQQDDKHNRFPCLGNILDIALLTEKTTLMNVFWTERTLLCSRPLRCSEKIEEHNYARLWKPFSKFRCELFLNQIELVSFRIGMCLIEPSM